MKKRLKIIALTTFSLIFALSSFVLAAEVRYFYNPNNGNTCFIDMDNIKNGVNIRVASVRWNFIDPERYQGTSSMVLQLIADCKNRKLASISSISYTAEGVKLKCDHETTELILEPTTKQVATFDVICGIRTVEQTLSEPFLLQNEKTNQ